MIDALAAAPGLVAPQDIRDWLFAYELAVGLIARNAGTAAKLEDLKRLSNEAFAAKSLGRRAFLGWLVTDGRGFYADYPRRHFHGRMTCERIMTPLNARGLLARMLSTALRRDRKD